MYIIVHDLLFYKRKIKNEKKNRNLMGEEFQKLDIEINYLYIAYGQSGKQL
jgi:hypothetical protein